jgi:glycine/D-amino acid oxidase-like deaminating enzyme
VVFLHALPCHALPNPAGLKIGKFSVSEACDPDNLDRQQRQADLLPLQAAVQEFMPHAAGPVTDFAACMFIMTPDGHFVIDTHPKHDQVSELRVGGVALFQPTAATVRIMA